MKKIGLPYLLPVVFLFSVCITSSCKKDAGSPGTGSGTITAVVSANPDLSFLSVAIIHAGLSGEYSDDVSYTLFAPTNDAFKAAGYSTINAINAEDPDIIADIIYYHTVDEILKVDDLLPGPNVPYETLNTDSIYITGTGGKYFINGAQLLTDDNIATNGVVHTISRLLTPPPGNIISVLQIRPELSFLVAAIQRASEGSTDIFDILSGDGPYTLFAPTNDAFKADGFATIDEINNADPGVLAGLLQYHILPARNYTCEFYDGYTPATLQGSAVSVNATGGYSVKGNADTNAASISSPDITAYNGVVHEINRMLHAL